MDYLKPSSSIPINKRSTNNDLCGVHFLPASQPITNQARLIFRSEIILPVAVIFVSVLLLIQSKKLNLQPLSYIRGALILL